MSPERRPNMGLLNGREQLLQRWSSINAVRRHVIEFSYLCLFSVIFTQQTQDVAIQWERSYVVYFSTPFSRSVFFFLHKTHFSFIFFSFIFSKHKTCLLLCCSMWPLNRKRDSNDLALALAFHFISFFFSLNLMASHQRSKMRTIFMSKPETFKCAFFDVGTGKRANQCSVSFLT